MAKKRSSPPTAPHEERADWASPAARVCWLIDNRFRGNRSAFASAVGFSHTSINKIAGGQQPGRKLLTAIAQTLRVSPAWLLNGEGQPFQDLSELAAQGIPVTDVLLPGPPLEHLEKITHGWLKTDGPLFTPSQYWLLLTEGQPLVGKKHLGFRPGDRLLMETDRARLPRAERLYGHLCVVQFPGGGESIKLASVTHYEASPDTGPEHIEADTFEPEVDPETIIREDIYRHHPDGKITHRQRQLQRREFQGKRYTVPVDEISEATPVLPSIRHTDIVAVWLQVMLRPRALM